MNLRALPLVCLMFLIAADQPASSPTTEPPAQPAAGVLEITDPFPPAELYAKLIGPVSKKYNVPIPGKSFHELRALRLTPDGRSHAPEPDAPELALPSDSALYTYYVPESYKPG